MFDVNRKKENLEPKDNVEISSKSYVSFSLGARVFFIFNIVTGS